MRRWVPTSKSVHSSSGPTIRISRRPVVGEYVVDGRSARAASARSSGAEHPLIGKKVAIKVLSRQYSADPEMVSRFVAEARAVNQIRHSNIIDIFAFGQLDDGRHYYVMEFLDGLPLDELPRARGRLALAEAIPILRAVARALDAAHAKGIAHRDLKPENVFLASDELDGVCTPSCSTSASPSSSQQDPGKAKHKTRTGAPMGTPYYMSPEQCRGRDVDHRTDVYAFGCMTYRILTGEYPFDGTTTWRSCSSRSARTRRRRPSECPGCPLLLTRPSRGCCARTRPSVRPIS